MHQNFIVILSLLKYLNLNQSGASTSRHHHPWSHIALRNTHYFIAIDEINVLHSETTLTLHF